MGSGNPTPSRSWLGNRNSLARLRRAAASSDWSLLICERGAAAPLSHFPPGHAGSERSSLPSVFRTRQYATTREARGRLGTPTSGRHRTPQGCEPHIAKRQKARGRLGTPTSGRHRTPQGCEPHIAKREKARGRLGTPTSGRHRTPQGCGRFIADRSHETPARKRRPVAVKMQPRVGTPTVQMACRHGNADLCQFSRWGSAPLREAQGKACTTHPSG